MSRRNSKSPWRLSTQIILAFVAAAIVIGFLFGEAIRYLESERLKTEVQAETQRTADLLGAVTIDALITEDGPALETIIQQAVERVAEIQCIIVNNEKGTELARWPRQKPTKSGPYQKLVGDVSLANEKFGSMTIRWSVGPAQQHISERVMQAWLYTTGILICATLIYYLLSNWLILRPLGRINFQVTSMAGSLPDDKLVLPSYSAQEFVSLAGSVNTLSEVLVERGERETALQKAKEAAEAADKSKSAFLAMMSHEIRTPMNGVVGALDLMRDTELSDDQNTHLEFASTATDSLLALIDDILDFSRIEAGMLPINKRDFAPESVVRVVMDTVSAAAANKNLKISSTERGHLSGRLVSDPGRIRQVLLNLVSNAIKFTETGSVEIVQDCRRMDAGILRFEIRDTGMGISREHQDILFREFDQIDSSYSRRFGGSGLGLAISKRIVDLLGGAIGFESTKDVGSTFWFTVPVAMARGHVEDRLEESGDQEPDIINSTILLVEDSMTNALIAKAFLEKKGANVNHVTSGTAAVEEFSRIAYDLVLMDVSMPGMDGLEATRIIRNREQVNRHIPIIAMTAHAIEGDRDRCINAGMDDYMTKPVHRVMLLQIVEKWLT